MKKNKKNLYVSLIVIAIVIPLVIGFSYAYFLARIEGSGTSTIKGTATNIFDIDLVTENDGYINATNMSPITAEEVPLKAEIAKFKVVAGNNEHKIKYDIKLTNMNLSQGLKNVSGFSYSLVCINDNSKNYSGSIWPWNGEQTIKSDALIDQNSTDEYELRLYILNTARDQTELMNQTFSAKVSIEASLEYNPTPSHSTLLKTAILGLDNSNVKSTLTTPGQAISTSSEAVLASTQDDYGTSYYYRGAVENNYVSFAGMCWRIVRVTGNGAIKLVLYNYNPNNVANPCDSAQDGTSNAFARYSENTYTTAFNTNYNQNAYIGLMYGTPGSSSYAEEHANTNKSTILTNLETWYNAKLSGFSSKLADTIWCNDKSTSTGSATYGTILGYATNQTGYAAISRLAYNGNWGTANGTGPSLICPNDNNGGKLSNFTLDDTTQGNGALTYKIGLLTADEVAFAGGIYATSNSTYYLMKNATSYAWWSLSPGYFSGSNAVEWITLPGGSLDSGFVYDVGGLRPAVSLVPTATVTGYGTQDSPYVVE